MPKEQFINIDSPHLLTGKIFIIEKFILYKTLSNDPISDKYVPKIYDFFVKDNEFVMELIYGDSLMDIVDELGEKAKKKRI